MKMKKTGFENRSFYCAIDCMMLRAQILATPDALAASATALAYNVARDFDKKVKRTKSQDNEVTAMMDELNESEKEQSMEEEHTK